MMADRTTILPALRIRGQWRSWFNAAAEALSTYTIRSFRLPSTDSASQTAADTQVEEFRSVEKAYRIGDNGRVLKRSLRLEECYILESGERFVPEFVVERLQNEAACMEFIQKHTDIPVPKLLDTYEEDGSYHLWMEHVDGVLMRDLTDDEKPEVILQVQQIISVLQTLRSKVSGGPTGTLSPPTFVCFDDHSTWQPRTASGEDFVFCHGDLSQNNILVDPMTRQITAILDWEFSGFFPPEHEIPFYESADYSGKQIKSDKNKAAVDKMIEFWRQSQVD